MERWLLSNFREASAVRWRREVSRVTDALVLPVGESAE
jgi:hypothetical protein